MSDLNLPPYRDPSPSERAEMQDLRFQPRVDRGLGHYVIVDTEDGGRELAEFRSTNVAKNQAMADALLKAMNDDWHAAHLPEDE